MGASIEAAILQRVIEPKKAGLSPEAARFLLSLDFPESDHARMAELSSKASDGTLSHIEEEELDGYLHISDLLALLQSKARVSLKTHGFAA